VLTAPSAPRAPLTVRLAGDPADVVTPVDHWAPRGTLLPQSGDLCLVAPDDEGHLWLAEWESTAQEPGGYDTAPIGSVMTWSGRSNPSAEYALANGQTLSRSAFPDGYAFAQQEQALGNPDWTTTSTTFTVPNYVGRFLFHRDVDAQGHKDGEKRVTLNVNQIPSHQHGLRGDLHGAGSGPIHLPPIKANTALNWELQPGSAPPNATPINPTGGGQSHNNMPPYVAVAMFVKVAGVTVSAGAIVGPSGADGRDGAPGGASGYHASEAYAGCSIPGTGPAGSFLVRGDLLVEAAGSYYVAIDVEISSGGAPLWSGTLSACDLGTNLPMSIAIPERVVTLGADADLTLSAYPSLGNLTESRLTALAFHDLAVTS
jgi:microcystin-dependent protein